MTLRRTAMKRKTELRRTPMPRSTRERAARVRVTVKRQRSTGPTPAQRSLVAERASYCCELCGALLHDGTTWTRPHSWHHRQARSMGGTSRPEANAAYNLLLLCGSGTTGCHGFVEAHRTAAEMSGWLVRHGQDPADVPVALNGHTMLVLLTVDGGYQAVEV